MVKTISFLIACAILALALFSFGCAGTTQPCAATASTTPSPTPTPRRFFSDGQIAEYAETYKALNTDDSAVLKQIAATDGSDEAARRAFRSWEASVEFEKVRKGTNAGDELNFCTRAEATALVDKRLKMFGTQLIAAAKDPESFLFVHVVEGKESVQWNDQKMLFFLAKEMSKRNLLLSDIGITGDQLKNIARTRAKKEIRDIVAELNDKDSNPADDYSPRAQAQKSWKDFVSKDPWNFAYDLVSEKELEALDPS